MKPIDVITAKSPDEMTNLEICIYMMSLERPYTAEAAAEELDGLRNDAKCVFDMIDKLLIWRRLQKYEEG